MLRRIYELTSGTIPLIGVGGIANGADAYTKIRAGATVVALTTTFPADAFEGVAAVITDFRSARARTSGERIVIDLDCLTR